MADAKEKKLVFGLNIAACRMNDAVAQLNSWIRQGGGKCQYVVTPNVDHIIMLEKNAGFRSAYESASLVVADGWPVVLAARMLGVDLPERIPGSELVPRFFESSSNSGVNQKVYLLGALPGVAELAADKIHEQWPTVEVVGWLSPEFGFEKDTEKCREICNSINASRANVLVIGLGAPKQELWIHAYADNLRVDVALCVGATIDFLAGNKKRAPRWVQRIGMEWLHRMFSEPRRLFGRYMRGLILFPIFFARELLLRYVLRRA